MYIPEEPTPLRRRRVPLPAYLRDLARYPARTLSDIAIDRPWVRGGALLLAELAVVGLALGATGLPGLGSGPAAAAWGLVAATAGGTLIFLVVSLVYHWMAKSLEGEGSFLDLVSALTFAWLPLGLLAPAALLRLLPGGWGGLGFFLACTGVALWTVRLLYLGVREAHRFTGTQAILTLTVPITMGFLLAFITVFVTAMGILVFG